MTNPEEEIRKLCKTIGDLETVANDLRDSLKTYQGRYHEAGHAHKQWAVATVRLKAYDDFIADLHRTSEPPG